MKRPAGIARAWMRVSARCLPFADAATADLPLPRLLRLSLFQISVGMATAMLIGTLNRVMIVELGLAAGLVSAMVALPLLAAPLRALLGYRSDTHRSVLGWRRVPYLWGGTLAQFGGLAIMPFALILLSGEGQGPAWVGQAGAALAFLLVGGGLQVTQTAGLALATDLAAPATRPRVVALMYVMLMVGMVAASLLLGVLLADYSPLRLIQVVQGAAVVTVGLNLLALWKQEPRGRPVPAHTPREPYGVVWRRLAQAARARRFLVAVALGTAAFSMQDVILEPYGGEILHLPVGATAQLTALMALGALAAFGWAARRLARGADPVRLAAAGALAGIAGFSAVVFAEPLASTMLFRAGAAAIGFGGGLFAVGTLTCAMGLDRDGRLTGLALGAWGAVQAASAGLAIGVGGALRDAVSALAMSGRFGEVLTHPATGYCMVYHLEITMLFATLVALGPLVRRGAAPADAPPTRFGLAELPH